jgi:hypothetical protein
VLFSVTVSEGCGLFCCCCGLGAAAFAVSLAWLVVALLIGLTIKMRSVMGRETLEHLGGVRNLW